MNLAGTGHRPEKLGGYTAAVAERLFDLARAVLVREAPTKVISGMALGWDTALALAALDLGIPLLAAVPFAGQERKWPVPSQEIYRAIIARAEVVVVCEGGYAPWKLQKRNEWMVDNADALIALWDGSSGGTANCVAYAAPRGIRMVNVWSTWERYAFRSDESPEHSAPGRQ